MTAPNAGKTQLPQADSLDMALSTTPNRSSSRARSGRRVQVEVERYIPKHCVSICIVT